MGKLWKKEDVDYLNKNYSLGNLDDISSYLGRTIKSISQKAHKLSLIRDESHRVKNMSNLNKEKGRNLTYSNLKLISEGYITHGEFRRNDYSAYLAIKKYGHTDLIEHLLWTNISLPQIILKELMDNILGVKCRYNDRKAIKPYELDLYYGDFDLAFEYNGRYWHEDNKNDEIKLLLCDDKKIKLITIEEHSRDYVNDIKNQIIDNLREINIKTNKTITKQDILDYDIDLEKVNIFGYNTLELFKKYKTLKEFKKDHYNIFRKLKKYGLLEKHLKHLL